MAAVPAQRQRREHLAAHFIIMGIAQRRAGRTGDRLKTGREVKGGGAQAKTGRQAPEPGAAADALAKVGDQFHILGPVAQPRAPVLRPRGRFLPQRIRQPQRRGRATLLKPELVFLKQTRDPQGHCHHADAPTRICVRPAVVNPVGLKSI